MNRKRLLTILIALLIFTSYSFTFAAPPEFSVESLDFTFSVPGCDFPVQAHLTGTLKVSIHSDRNGNFKMRIERVLQDAQSTYTNLDTGASITSSHGSGMDKVVVDEDGTELVIVTGVFDILPVPGEGLIVHDVGRIIFNPATQEILFSAGQFTVHGPGGSIEALCAALA